MPGDFDPTVKIVVETSPADWLALTGRPPAPVTVIDAEVSAVLSGAADKFLRVDAVEPYVLHLDFQSGHDSASLPGRLHLYNAVASYRTGLPVRSVAVLLRPEADSPRLTGVRESRLHDEDEPEDRFRYQVLRVWQVPADQLLRGGLGAVALAPVGAVSQAELPAVIRRMERRFRGVAQSRELWTATRVLMGLRYPADIVAMLLRGITQMKESTTYQAIVAEGLAEGLAEGRAKGLAEGRVEEARRLLLMMGQSYLGQPSRAERAALDAIPEVERLEELTVRAPRAASWHDLLGLPAPRRRPRRRS